ncbi:hypothetical protein [Merismopedia glauca]|uniref:Uncharacterized protein n=1 Tax=Merismopedia glauca CCAP 1448/3 TaxID=1296344 RepID=A0A2T1BWL5_9CYAN|nr:hypothetical protein [Merismopedia glauca]PSB00405.1 hypothetical protein C7B64_23715 [Merismopedia glauca CCAP 1448/3]
MGQYHLIVNLDKKEYLNPSYFGDGLKLWEFAGSKTTIGLTALLTANNEGAGGDFNVPTSNHLIGSWAGDKIAIIGDYQQAERLDGITYQLVEATFDNISTDLMQILYQDRFFSEINANLMNLHEQKQQKLLGIIKCVKIILKSLILKLLPNSTVS